MKNLYLEVRRSLSNDSFQKFFFIHLQSLSSLEAYRLLYNFEFIFFSQSFGLMWPLIIVFIMSIFRSALPVLFIYCVFSSSDCQHVLTIVYAHLILFMNIFDPSRSNFLQSINKLRISHTHTDPLVFIVNIKTKDLNDTVKCTLLMTWATFVFARLQYVYVL